MNSKCICPTDQSSICGFDHINGERPSVDCRIPEPHTTTLDHKYRKVVTREFPLQENGKLLASRYDPLTLVVRYDYSNKQNNIIDIKLKTFDKHSNLTCWYDLSKDDLNTFIRVFSMVKNDIEADNQQQDIVLF